MAPRGSIFDSDNKILVKDELSFNASVIYGHIKNRKELEKIFEQVESEQGKFEPVWRSYLIDFPRDRKFPPAALAPGLTSGGPAGGE